MRSLRVRILLLTAAVVLVACALTAVLVARSTERAVADQAERSLETDATIYQELAVYGATHDSWSGVGQTVRDLAGRTGRRIALVSADGRRVADSALLVDGAARPLPQRAAALLDPATGGSPVLGSLAIADVRLAGVYAVTGTVGAAPVVAVEAVADPLAPAPSAGGASALPAGQPAEAISIDEATLATANRAASVTGDCLARAGVEAVSSVDPTGLVTVLPAAADDAANAAYARCAEAGVRASVAPPVRLFLGEGGAGLLAIVGPDTLRLLLLGLGVLAAALPVAFLVARRISRPLDRLTTAARRIEGGDLGARVPDGGTDEVGQLAHAFNALAGSLERNEAARRRMVSDIAHELGNPLVTIGGTLEALQDGVYAPGPDVIDALAEETGHLRLLVDDLAQLAQADAGALRLVPAPADVASLARSVAEAHRGAAVAAGVEVAVDAPDALRGVVDADRTRQILANLVGNAIRHTPPGGRVEVRVVADDPRVRVEVEDSGEGIPADALPHVFERFYRVDPARGRATGGTGLGLAIARELAVAQGGAIAATSAPGRGSTFTVTLPAAP